MKGARKRETAELEAVSKKQKTANVAGGCADQVAVALRKIRCYVGLPTKFNKAARLVLNLCQEGHMTAVYGDLFFEVLALAMMDREACLVPENCKAYCKLISKAVEFASLFSPLQRRQLEVYQIWSLCRSELNTDDSFLFGKNMAKLRELALQLPQSSRDEESIYQGWLEKRAALVAYYEKHRREREIEEHNRAEPSLVWSEEESLVVRREAIVDWLERAKARYRQQWACTAIDMSIKMLSENKDKFTEGQRRRIEALLGFSKAQILRRQQGPTFKEKRRDTTSFEEARSEWSKEKISSRGMVGASGDHRSEAWLG